ncbi:MAG: hypothetical protein ACKV0T_09355 [Planctomycetales bacterium]
MSQPPSATRSQQRLLVQTLRIDLSGSDLPITHPSPPAEADQVSGRQIAIGQLGLVASPLTLFSAALHVELSAAEVVLTHAPDDPDRPFGLNLQRGAVTVEIGYAELDSLIVELLNRQLQSHHVTITKAQLKLESEGPRSVRFSGRATGRRGIFSSTLEVQGKVDVDEQLNARLSGLTLSSPGLVGQVIARFLQPHVEALDERPIPLGAAWMGRLQFTQIELHLGERLRLVGSFGPPNSESTKIAT